MSDPYFSRDRSIRGMEGEVLAVFARGDARRWWRWRQGEVKDELTVYWNIPFRYVEVVCGGNIGSVIILDFQSTTFRKDQN